MSGKSTLVWFRHDLRASDNPAFRAAAEGHAPVVPVYIWAPDEEGDWSPGAASRWWLHHSLTSLRADLQRYGLRLVVRGGNSRRVLEDLIAETGADRVVWNRLYAPAAVRRDKEVASWLRRGHVDIETFNGSLLWEPWQVSTQQGAPYKAFTPFWKACRSRDEPEKPAPPPAEVTSPDKWPSSQDIDSLELLPKTDWASGLRDAWQPGANGARRRLTEFLSNAMESYRENRDRPDLRGTSRLSPHLHFGEIGPREIWHAVRSACSEDRRTKEGKSAELFLTELGWREFAHHVLYHFPHTTDAPLQQRFARFPWEQNRAKRRAWEKGQTGFPIVDAGMRELWSTGWMHNRVRMIVGSFLTKDLLISWQQGARWFWDTLVDADLANNTLGWQWVSGCGADAAPYFRVFNPVRQGEKFDPAGDYVRRWVPELAALPDRWVHQPWEAPPEALSDANVVLGESYPRPIVDHGQARRSALEAFEAVKRP